MTLHEQAASLGIKVDGRWSEKRLRKAIEDAGVKVQPAADYSEAEAMNAYALKIWHGQSPDMPKHERIDRVKAGLIGQRWGDILELLDLPDA